MFQVSCWTVRADYNPSINYEFMACKPGEGSQKVFQGRNVINTSMRLASVVGVLQCQHMQKNLFVFEEKQEIRVL